MSDLDRLEALFAVREPEVRAFMPEERRFERLRREAAALAERWPDAARRPPLFGVLVGVKDIFHVDGFETRGGSRLRTWSTGWVAPRLHEAVRPSGRPQDSGIAVQPYPFPPPGGGIAR